MSVPHESASGRRQPSRWIAPARLILRGGTLLSPPLPTPPLLPSTSNTPLLSTTTTASGTSSLTTTTHPPRRLSSRRMRNSRGIGRSSRFLLPGEDGLRARWRDRGQSGQITNYPSPPTTYHHHKRLSSPAQPTPPPLLLPRPVLSDHLRTCYSSHCYCSYIVESGRIYRMLESERR